MKRKDYPLNSVYLRNRIVELGLKQWWLAEQIGVDRKTVNRWLQGQVKSIQSENVEGLCRVLNCSASELCLESTADQLASVDDQKQAALLLSQSLLLEKLGPIGEWNVIESLLKATIVPGLPINVLGELYNQLTIASWRQSKIDQADAFNQKALKIANQCQDKALLAQAKLSQANIFSWRGNIQRSIETYEEIILLKDYISAKALGATYSNFGAVLYEGGDLDRGKEFQKKSIELFLLEGKPMNLSISYGHLAVIYLKNNQPELAQVDCEKSIQYALADQYLRGQIFGGLIQAEIFACKNLKGQALDLMKKALGEFSTAGIEEGLNYEIAGRICRLVGELADSKAYLEKGITLAEQFPVYQAALYFELAKTLREMRLPAQDAATKARELYSICGAPLKIIDIEGFLNSLS